MSPTEKVVKAGLTVWEKMRSNRYILIYIAFVASLTLALMIEAR